jgi:hypothetical protein
MSVRLVSRALLIAGIGALFASPLWNARGHSWTGLLGAYATGAPLPGGSRITALARGYRNEVVVTVADGAGGAAAEIHILPRGCWAGVRTSTSFDIAYETPHSPAADRDQITERLAETIRAGDAGLPPPDAIPLRGVLDTDWWLRTLNGWRGVLILACIAWLVVVGRAPSAAVAALGAAFGVLGVLTSVLAVPGVDPSCPALDLASLIGLDVRVMQAGWAISIAAAPLLCYRAARAVGLSGMRMLAAAALCVIAALGAIRGRADAPLHANGHNWREAREVLVPWGERDTGAAAFLHGRSAIALQWQLAAAERWLTGSANPFRISRIAGPAAAGATAVLGAVATQSLWAGAAAGLVWALMPLPQMLMVSGSALSVPAALVPWSLALTIAAAASGEPLLLGGAALAAALGILSHTAMLAWPAALVAAWLLAAAANVRWRRAALLALLVVGAAWAAELGTVYEMVVGRNQTGGGLLGGARVGILHRDLLTDPRWVSPVVVALALLGALTAVGRRRVGAVLAALCIAAAPFFAVIACSSDAVRYQTVLLPLVIALAVAGLWVIPVPGGIGLAVAWPLRVLAVGAMIALPRPAERAPTDPAVIEHALVADAVARMPPNALIVLPRAPDASLIRHDFPDFLLPPGSAVVFDGDPAIGAHAGPRFDYLGLACVAWMDEPPPGELGLRPECRALRRAAQPWVVRALQAADLPRTPDGEPWTFNRLALGVPFGFFVPNDSR